MVNYLRVLIFLLFAAALALPIWASRTVESQSATEAPAGFDTLTNDATFVSQATHDADRGTFEERDDVVKGLGPVYNAQSCAECHQNPVTGGISQISELRAGHNDGSGNFVPATLTINDGGGLVGITIANRSLINQRATCPGVVTDVTTHAIIYNHPNEQAQERVPGAETVPLHKKWLCAAKRGRAVNGFRAHNDLPALETGIAHERTRLIHRIRNHFRHGTGPPLRVFRRRHH